MALSEELSTGMERDPGSKPFLFLSAPRNILCKGEIEIFCVFRGVEGEREREGGGWSASKIIYYMLCYNPVSLCIFRGKALKTIHRDGEKNE